MAGSAEEVTLILSGFACLTRFAYPPPMAPTSTSSPSMEIRHRRAETPDWQNERAGSVNVGLRGQVFRQASRDEAFKKLAMDVSSFGKETKLDFSLAD